MRAGDLLLLGGASGYSAGKECGSGAGTGCVWCCGGVCCGNVLAVFGRGSGMCAALQLGFYSRRYGDDGTRFVEEEPVARGTRDERPGDLEEGGA